MGSGLILLVIVAAWLAVLVPMALRSREATTSLSSVDRFNDAMRVLSRRPDRAGEARRAFVLPPHGDAGLSARTQVPLATRRRRVLLVLVTAALLTLVAAAVASTAWLFVHGAVDVLVIGYVVHLRQQALLNAARREHLRSVALEHPIPTQRRHRVAGIPERMPARVHAVRVAASAPAARYEDPMPAAPRRTWESVPIPAPTYVGAPVAPSRPPRVLDLTRPGKWSASVAEDLALLDGGPDLEEILEPRRAVND
ncbi:MAG TPA: hypothetical protein VNA30_05415 [Mycobacteriales bacterium]|nr:hypothetical protein [Mycobacteriales bacterium]